MDEERGGPDEEEGGRMRKKKAGGGRRGVDEEAGGWIKREGVDEEEEGWVKKGGLSQPPRSRSRPLCAAEGADGAARAPAAQRLQAQRVGGESPGTAAPGGPRRLSPRRGAVTGVSGGLCAQEAASLIAQRPVNPRDIFKQREKSAPADAAAPSQPGTVPPVTPVTSARSLLSAPGGSRHTLCTATSQPRGGRDAKALAAPAFNSRG